MAGFYEPGIPPELPEAPLCEQVRLDWPNEPQPFETACAFDTAYFDALDAILAEGASLASAEGMPFGAPLTVAAYSGISQLPTASNSAPNSLALGKSTSSQGSASPLSQPAPFRVSPGGQGRAMAAEIHEDAKVSETESAPSAPEIPIAPVPLAESGAFLIAAIAAAALLSRRRVGGL